MILVQNVSKLFRLYNRPSDRFRESLPVIGRKRHAEFWALRDVNVSVAAGETLGVVGPNGSGKSTLLQIVSGILQPTSGRVLTEGRIAALLELGAGFNPDFTGRENVYLNGEIMGLSKAEIRTAFPAIEEFAGIGKFVDRPVKEYSSGMYVRLAFSTAIHVDPDILIVDEALAVGDAIFSSRCVQKFEELKERNVTVLFVSHDLGLVKQLADRAIFLLDGRVEAEGNPRDVVNRYIGAVLARDGQPVGDEIGGDMLAASHRHGDGRSQITGVTLLDAQGRETSTVGSGDLLTVRVSVKCVTAVDELVVGLLIRNRLGADVFGTNTRIEGQEVAPADAGTLYTVDFSFHCDLTRQEYTLTVATQNRDGTSQDWLDDVLSFSVVDTKDKAGVASLKTQIHWKRT